MSETLFSIENLRVAYPQFDEEAPIWAVNDVSFALQPGEKMGLVGESGCGKSTIGRAIMRLLPASSRVEGKIIFRDDSVLDLTPVQMQKFRGEAVALVFQDPMTRLDPLMTIGNHCLETLAAHSPELTKQQAKEKALATLEKVKIPASRWSQYPHEFSGGMRQRVAIALALLLNPKLIVADEPTTSLDVTVSAQILQELTRLCAEDNMGLLLISHDLAMVGEYCDRIGVMYQGKMVETGKTENVFKNPQHEYTQSLLKAALHIQQEEVTGNTSTSSVHRREQGTGIKEKPILKLTELQKHYTIEPNFIERIFKGEGQQIKAVDGINLELYPGEILGLVGESGCGKSTLSRTILQLIPPTGGKVEFLGQDLTKLSRKEIRDSRRQIQMVFQDPHACLNPAMTVGQSIADPLLIHNLANAEKAKEKVLWMLEKVGLTPAEMYYQRYPSDLSGGQQQRVAIARALITQPKLVICDEPVSMLDASVQSQVLDLMLQLKDEFELTYLFITHDLWLARFLCDRIAVMNGGKIVELGNTKEIFAHPQHPYTKTLLAAAPLLARV
ncbi:ABC transporter ATP-binding protein [Anabaena aphanizomenioides LEGE 00250]|uniref:ABC transporter ATP-binding protein n=1 Tax=Sphaerospermopsis aphanizomenoides LEGE 00250 TaxID=2777972 RepID=A0ABR9VI48_9CYAN|nr:ABC transporter ATP-binding protein [Sphaerospermopsis aphanizomenoides]MBE9238173.1 ABC transporter ATP-binding protein [Sphaerospermopsis aphanizomenoides LEGE 00250]